MTAATSVGETLLDDLLELSEAVSPEPVFWSRDGSSVLYVGSSGLLAVDPAGGRPEVVCDELGGMPFLGTHEPRISPDGRFVAFLSNAADETGEGLEVEIWLKALGDGAPPRRLTHLGASINSFSWSPDSTRIAFSSSLRGRFNVYSIDVSSGRVAQHTDSQSYEVYPAFADDSHIVYVRLDSTWTEHEVIALDTRGGAAVTLARDEGFFDYHYGRTFGYPLASPDGADLLFRSHRSGWINYWLVSRDSNVNPAPLVRAEADQSDARWSPDGGRVAYIENHDGTCELRVLDRASGAVAVLDDGPDCACALPAWSPDGNRIAYLRQSTVTPLGVWVVDIRSLDRVCLTKPARDLDLVVPEKITYPTFDGREIHGYLYRPPAAPPHGNTPGLMWVHGGPTSQFSDTYQPWVQFFARSGYTVLLPNIRGSSGYGKEFEDLNDRDWGHDDLKDVVAGVDYLGGLGTVDTDRMGIHGTSYGGCMSMAAVAWAPGVFKAAIPHAGYADWEAMFSEQELRHLQLLRYELGPFPEAVEVYRRCSPIHDLAAVETPTFVVHGAGRLPKSDASRQFVEEMRRLYKPVRYRVYEGECYYVRSHAGVRQMLTDMRSFLDQHLQT